MIGDLKSWYFSVHKANAACALVILLLRHIQIFCSYGFCQNLK